MSNYLNRLVTRSLNPTEVSVQPRMPSLFEPTKGVPPLGTFPVDSGESEAMPAFATPEPRAMASPRMPTRIEESQPAVRRSPSPLPSEPSSLEPRSTLDVGELRFVPPPPTFSEPSTVAPRTAVPHPQQDQFTPADRVPNIAKAADFPDRKPAIVQSRVIQRSVEQIFGYRSENTDTSTVSARGAIRSENSLAPIASVRSTPNEPPIAVRHPATAIVKPQIVPLTQPIKETAVASPALPQPAPTIQVTIGRIEVRATAPANPSSTQTRQQPPVMSLEEYLRQRGGGK